MKTIEELFEQAKEAVTKDTEKKALAAFKAKLEEKARLEQALRNCDAELEVLKANFAELMR